MAIIDVGVRVNLEDSSLRSLQTQLRNAVQSVNPQLDIDINEDQLRRFIRGATNVSLRVTGLEGQDEIRRGLRQVLENQVVRVAGFDRRDLTRLRRELQEQLEAVNVGTRALPGARRGLQAAQAGVGASTTQVDVNAARQEVERLENQIASGRENIQRILQDVIELQQAQREFTRRTTEVQRQNARAIERRRISEFLQEERELIQAIRTEKEERQRLARNTERLGQQNFQEEERALVEAIRTERRERERLARNTEQRAAQDFQEEERALREAIRQERASRERLARLGEQRARQDFNDEENALKQAISQERQSRERLARNTEERARQEFSDDERQLIQAIRREREERERLARNAEQRARQDFTEEERQLRAAIRQEREERQRLARAAEQRARQDFTADERALRDAIRSEKEERERLARLAEERARQDFTADERALIRAIRDEREERQRLARLSEERARTNLLEEERLLRQAIRDEREERERLARLAEQRAVQDFREEERALIDAVRQERREREERARQTDARGAREFREAERALIAAIREDERILRERLASFRDADRRGITATGDFSEEEVRRRTIEELSRKVVAEAGNTREALEELRLRTTGNSLLERTIRRQITTDLRAIDERERLVRQELNALSGRVRQQLRSSIFARNAAQLEQDLSDVLRQRVEQARQTSGLGENLSNPLQRAQTRLAGVISRVADAFGAVRANIRRGFGTTIGDFENATGENVRELQRGTLAVRNLRRQQTLLNQAYGQQVDAARDVSLRLAGLNTAIAASANAQDPERVQRLAEERLRLETRLNNATGNVERTRRRIAEIDEQISQTRARFLQRARREANRGATTGDGGGGGGGGGRTVTFRGASDITNFARQLPTSQLELFAKTLLDVRDSGQQAGRGIQRFNATIRQGTPVVERLRANIALANRDAFEFGVRTAQAARRLLEWATPAQFIFATIGRLREALDVITDIDVQARRLVIFSEDSPFRDAAVSTQAFQAAVDRTQTSLTGFINLSRQLGISTQNVAEAFVTAARVGVPGLASQIERLSQGFTNLEPGLVRSTLQLVRLEQGSLSAEVAVRRLRAIQAQFIESLNLTEAEGAVAVDTIGALLARAAANSTFNVNELANAVTRLGTSFVNIQGANLPAVIEIIGTVARATGAEVGRIATTFRQLTTLTVQNAEELRRAFDIDIIDPETGRQTFEGLLEFLREVDRLSGVSAEQASALARLGTDRRNVNEVKQFASVIGDLEDAYGRLSGPQAQVALAGQAVEEAFLNEQLLAQSLQGSFNRLDSTFQELTNTLLQSTAFQGIVDGFTSVVGAVDSVIANISRIRPAFEAIGVLILGRVLPTITAALGGFASTIFDAFTGGGRGRIQSELSTLFSTTQGGIRGINRARAEGLISTQEQRKLSLQQIGLIEDIAVEEQGVKRLLEQGNLEREKAVALETENFELVAEIEAAQERLNRAISREKQFRERNSRDLRSREQGFLQRNASRLGAIAVLLGGFAAQQIGSGIEGEQSAIGRSVGSALTGAISGGLIGAQVGALFAGVGAPLGAAAGAAIGGTIAGIREFGQAQEEIEKNAEQNQEAIVRRLAAEENQRRIIEAQQERNLLFAEERTKAEQRLVELTNEVASAQQAVSEAEGDQEEQLAALANLTELQVRLETAKAAVQREQVAIQERQLAVAASINRVRREETELLQRIGLLREAATVGLAEEQVIPLTIEFNRQAISQQVDSVREQIAIELERQQSVELQTDIRAFEQSRQRVLDLQARERQLQLQSVQQEIQQRRRLQDRRFQLVQEEVGKLNEAADNFGQALETAFESQLSIANAVLDAGQVAAQALANRGQEFLGLLEASGAEVTVRLRALQRQTNRELARLRANQALAEQAFASTGVESFSGAREIDAALENVARELRIAGARASDKVFNEVSAEFDVDLQVQRERARLARQEFNQRLSQTREELSIRQEILRSESELIQRRIDAERELRSLRIDQQREFGRLLLQGPEEFQQAVGNIRNATRFFRGVDQLDARNLQRIADRTVQLRARGRFDILRSVQQGLSSLIQTGGARVVGAATNEQLLRIFEQTATSGLPGGTNPQEVALQLERQVEEAKAQTREQQQLRQRQEELQRIAFRQAQLQEAEARLQAEDALIASRQRDRLLASARQRFQELQQIKLALVDIQANGIRLATGGPGLGAPNAAGAPLGQGPRFEQGQAGDIPAAFAAVLNNLPTELGGELANQIRTGLTESQTRVQRLRARTELEPVLQDLIRLNAIQLREALNDADFADNAPAARQEARDRAARQLQLLRTADPLDTSFRDAIDSLSDTILEAREGGDIGQALPDFERFIEGFSVADQEARRLAESSRFLNDRQRFLAARNAQAEELQNRLNELLRRQSRERRDLSQTIRGGNVSSREQIRLQEQLLQRQLRERIELRDANNRAIAAQVGASEEVFRLTTRARQLTSAFGILEEQVGQAGGAGGEQEDRFLDLRQGLRPPVSTPQDNLPGIRQNLGFNRVISEFFNNLELRQNEGFVAIPRELARLRQAIDTQNGVATPRQERRLRELQRQEESFGVRFAGRRAARDLVQDPRALAGVEGGFRELLQGNTDFVRQLREITQTERGTRVQFRGRRELDVQQLTNLLEDAGLSGIAGNIEGRTEGARVASRLLELSRTLERNQGPLNQRQIRQLAEILGQEFSGAFESVAEAQEAANNNLVRALDGRREGEDRAQFDARRRREEADAFTQAARQAIEGINQQVFQEAAAAVGNEIGNRVVQAQLDAAGQIQQQLQQLEEIRVGFQDNLSVQVEAQVQNNLRVDQRFIDALRDIFPNITDTQLNALVRTVSALARVERGRGTPLPAEAGELVPPGNN